MSFKRAVANMIESFKDAMEGQDLAQMREEFAGMLPEGQDPLVLQLLGTIAGNLGGKGVDPARLGVLVAVIAGMARDAVESPHMGHMATAATIARAGKKKTPEAEAPIPADGKCRVKQTTATSNGGGTTDGPTLYAEKIYEYDYDTTDGHVHLYEEGGEEQLWECTVAVFKTAFVILQN
jgi:hypothetical protein